MKLFQVHKIYDPKPDIKIQTVILFWWNHRLSVYINTHPLPIRCLFRWQEILNLLHFGNGCDLFTSSAKAIHRQSIICYFLTWRHLWTWCRILIIPCSFTHVFLSFPKIYHPKLALILQWTLIPSSDENNHLEKWYTPASDHWIPTWWKMFTPL